MQIRELIKPIVLNAAGNNLKVTAKFMPGSKKGMSGADIVQAKAAITRVCVADGVQAEVRLYDRLFAEVQPDAGGKDFLQSLNPESLKVLTAYMEPSWTEMPPDRMFQFERLAYFLSNQVYHSAQHLVFNKAVGLKDSWGK